MAQLETEQTEKSISNTESLIDPSNQTEDNITEDIIPGENISDNESLTDPSSNQNQEETGENTGTTNQTGEDNINQEETLGDNGTTGDDTGTTDKTTSNNESLTDPSTSNDTSTSSETSTYTPDEIIEMTKQTSDQVDTSSDQAETSSPIIYIPKTLILGQDGSCDYIVQADTSTLQTNQEIQVIPSETFEMTNIHNENLKYIGTTSQDKNIITSSEPLIQGNLRCNIKRPGSYKGTVQFDISIKTQDITNIANQ